MIPTTMSV